MQQTFSNIVAEIQQFSMDEKEELHSLLEKYLIEERREQIYRNYQESVEEVKNGTLKFSSNIDELKRMLEE